MKENNDKIITIVCKTLLNDLSNIIMRGVTR